jgi:hypothetical protein
MFLRHIINFLAASVAEREKPTPVQCKEMNNGQQDKVAQLLLKSSVLQRRYI